VADLTPVDPTTNPFLRGRFEPVHHEVTAQHLAVEGTLPAGLLGTYLRNGPNPALPPLGSYTFPLEGDAMIHATTFDAGGSVHYRNRWVRTKGMEAEQRAGRSLFGGLMTPAFVDPSLLGEDPDPGWPFRLDPFINVVRHGGRLLALSEAVPAYEVTDELETVGLFDFDGAFPAMCAHPRRDPVTGELVFFAWAVTEPYLVWMTVGTDGTVTRPPTPIDVDAGYMIHDCVITPTYLVLTIAPVVFDLDVMTKGGNPLAWKPALGTKLALVPRDGSEVRWIHADPYFVWHHANAYDEGTKVVVDFSKWSKFAMGPDPSQHGSFTRSVLDPVAGTISMTDLDQIPSEFARIDDRLTGLEHRYVTLSRKSGKREGLIQGEFDQLCRYDMKTGECASYDSDLVFGEVIFAPRHGGTDELDGFYLTYATDHAATSSRLLIWDAQSFPSPPVAKVVLPQRVPNGLHGSWLA
jgi:carotenoid cleavage dioxygenase